MHEPLPERIPVLVGDLEANGLLDTADTIWCGVFKDISSGRSFVYGPDDIQQIVPLLDRTDVLVMHNGVQYDLPLLDKVLGYKFPGRVVDTLLMSRLQNPDRATPKGCSSGPHSVEAWGYRLGRAKPGHEDWSQYSPEMLHRCKEDVEIQHRILDALVEEAKGKDYRTAHRVTAKLFDILGKQERYGWLVDQAYMHKCRRQLHHWMQRIEKATAPHLPMLCERPKKVRREYVYYKKPFRKDGTLQAYVLEYLGQSTVAGDGPLRDVLWSSVVAGPFSVTLFRRVNLGSNKEVKDFLLESGWVPEQWNVNDNGERTSPKLSHTESFEGVNGQLGRLIARWIQCRHRDSQIKNWEQGVRDDGRVAQKITGIASTGRLTHSGIVNVPGTEAFYGKQMRKCFIAKPGYKIVGVDSDACQNRMLAGRVNNPDFTKTLLDGKKEDRTSIHYVNQAAITRVAGFTPSYKVCKNLNYAFLFGASDRKLATTANVSEGLGSKIRESLLSVAPGLEAVIQTLEAEWKSTAKVRKGRYGKEYYDGYITGLDGRPVKIASAHCLLVYILQSDEALLMQYALLFLYKWLTDKGWVHGREYGFVANIHDEFQAEVREDLAEEYAELACKAITHAGEFLGINCPHVGQADIGDNWYETH